MNHREERRKTGKKKVKSTTGERVMKPGIEKKEKPRRLGHDGAEERENMNKILESKTRKEMRRIIKKKHTQKKNGREKEKNTINKSYIKKNDQEIENNELKKKKHLTREKKRKPHRL